MQRKCKAINIEGIKSDIKNTELIRFPKTSATELAEQYDTALRILINLHAPLDTKKISAFFSKVIDKGVTNELQISSNKSYH